MDNQAFRDSNSGDQEKKSANATTKGEGNPFAKWSWKPLGDAGDRGPFFGSGYPLGVIGQVALFFLVAFVAYIAIPFEGQAQGGGYFPQKNDTLNQNRAFVLQDKEPPFELVSEVRPSDHDGAKLVTTQNIVQEVKQEHVVETIGYLDLVHGTAVSHPVSQKEQEDWTRDFLLANRLLSQAYEAKLQALPEETINVLRRLKLRTSNQEKQKIVIRALERQFITTSRDAKRFRPSHYEVKRSDNSLTQRFNGALGKTPDLTLTHTGGVIIHSEMSNEELALSLIHSVKSNFRDAGAFYIASKMQVPVQ